MSDRSKLKLLVIEDDAIIRKMLVSWFENGPYDFLEADDGAFGLQLAFSELPDVIISDLMLPVMDGVTVIRSLRATNEFATTPIIAITAGTDEMKEDARRAGANIVLPKPLREQEVVKTVEDFLTVTPFVRNVTEDVDLGL